jgi:hypothetical protein
MTRILTEVVTRHALLAACVCALSACSAYEDGLISSNDSQERGAVGSTGDAVDAGVAESVPEPLSVASGEACTEDAECMSGYCVGERCCVEGLCCNEDADCPGDQDFGMACDDAPSCQGSRGVLQCRERRCVTNNGEPDDRACSPEVEAADCDEYRPVFCTGEVDQQAPSCPRTCEEDSECDDDAHCQDGACVPDATDGNACEREGECASGRCNNAVCCTGVDCCAVASDCPPRYSAPPACDDKERCQGTRTLATCVDFSCGSELVADDSACDASVAAADCGPAPDLFCSAGEDQQPPECSSSFACGDDSQCDADTYCGSGSGCLPARVDGEGCSRDAECESDHCNAGLCCRDGDCCTDDDDCESRYVCTNPRECRGQLYRQQCSDAFRCEEAEPEESSYGCVGQLARVCDNPGYRDVVCYLLPVPYVRECSSCQSDSECTRDYECRGGECRLQPRDDASN